MAPSVAHVAVGTLLALRLIGHDSELQSAIRAELFAEEQACITSQLHSLTHPLDEYVSAVRVFAAHLEVEVRGALKINVALHEVGRRNKNVETAGVGGGT